MKKIKQAGAEMCQAHIKLWFWFGLTMPGLAWLGLDWHGLVWGMVGYDFGWFGMG